MNLDSYSIQELESIDFRSSLGKKIKCEMGISTKEIKKRINEIILKKKSVKIENEKSAFFISFFIYVFLFLRFIFLILKRSQLVS